MTDILAGLARLEMQNAEILARLDRLDRPQEPRKQTWSPEELAVALHRKPFTVREWCRLKRIQAVKERYTRLWRIPDAEARRLIAGGGLNPEMTV
jgi:hypothetical protein